MNIVMSWNSATKTVDILNKHLASLRIIASTETELGYGGMIVLSTDVNATKAKGLRGWIESTGKTMTNRLFCSRMVDSVIQDKATQQGLQIGWSVGRMFKGRYFSPKSKKPFNEKSFSVDLRGAPIDFVKEVGAALAKKFNQEAVLIIDHKSGKSSLLEP